MRRQMMVMVAVLAVIGAACGGDQKVGNEGLVDFGDQVQQRLGDATPTPKATKAPTGTPNAGSKQAVSTPVPTPVPVVSTIDVKIQGDAVGSAFDPPVVQIFVGSIVRFTNTDTEARSVEADDGAFSSGSLAPGKSWSYTGKEVGRFNYHDGTRPYAIGRIEVVDG